MNENSERRVHPRFDLQSIVYCYAEGYRIDCRCSNISSGGILVHTDVDLAKGINITLVIAGTTEAGQSPVFCTGTVVRPQGGKNPGYGIRWIRAVTQGESAYLTAFLRNVLHVEHDELDLEEVTRDGVVLRRCKLYAEDTSSAAKTAAADYLHEVITRETSSTKQAGPLTQRIRSSDLRAPCGLGASILLGDSARASCKIGYMGLTSMFLFLDGKSAPSFDKAVVTFEIKTVKGPSPIHCHCENSGGDGGESVGLDGIELTIVRVDEGTEKGLFERYVRWLHYRAVQKFSFVGEQS
jgi:hypothetical protein